MIINPRVLAIDPPAIGSITQKIEELRKSGRDVISLAQAVSDQQPPASALNAVRRNLHKPWMHSYSADPGLPAARTAVAAWLAGSGRKIDADGGLLLTAGASGAFMTGLLTLAGVGEQIVIPEPYYFDHQYAVLALGLVPRYVPLVVRENRWRFDVPALVAAARQGARAIVLVSPNNPTGARLADDELQELARGLDGTECAILSDETYECFVFDDKAHASPAAVDGLVERTLLCGTFSKSLGLAGWRIGFLAGPRAFVQEALKVQDTQVICAPVPSQIALIGALEDEELSEWLLRHRRELESRRKMLREGLETISDLQWREPSGAFFAFPRLAGDVDDRKICADLLEQEAVACLPGSAFGPSGRGHLRLSFGNVTTSRLEEACTRMARFF